MKKIYSSIMMFAMMVAALSLTACGGDGNDDEIDGGGSYTLTVTNAEGKVNHTFPKDEDIDWIGHLTNESDKSTIWCFMAGGTQYLHVYLEQNDFEVSDFGVGYDLGTPIINYGTLRTYTNEYEYESGSIRVIKNDGNHFTLKFDDYFARNYKFPSKTILIKGTLEVEKERYF